MAVCGQVYAKIVGFLVRVLVLNGIRYIVYQKPQNFFGVDRI